MNAPISLLRRILAMKFPWNIWVLVLATVNVGGGIFFFEAFEGKAALAAMAAAFTLMTLLYVRFGFCRLLGLAHIFWIPLVIDVGTILTGTWVGDGLDWWCLSLVVVNSLSLVIDTVDVIRWFRGERGEI